MMKVLLALEGNDDVRRVPQLLDWWLTDNVPWFDADNPCCEFVVLEDGPERRIHIPIKTITKLRKQLVRGGFGGPHPSGDAGTLHNLFIVLAHLGLDPDVIVWVRDEDGAPQRALDARQYVADRALGDRIVMAYARQTSDAWVLVGWLAESSDEQQAEAALEDESSRKLPRDAHKFSHRDEGCGVKWAVRMLCKSHERQDRALERAWRMPDADLEECGLAGFRRALDEHATVRRALGLPPSKTAR